MTSTPSSNGPGGPPARHTAPREDEVLDAITLQGLRELGGEDDPGLFAELIDLFLEDAPLRMEELRRGLDKRDMPLLERAAHTLKSSSANIGALSMSCICKRIETSVRSQRCEEVASLVEESRVLWPQVEAALRAAKS